MSSAGVRYRYKGVYISAANAARYNNLRNAAKFITTEFTYNGKSDIARRGYKKPVEKQVIVAIGKSRADAAGKRKAFEPKKEDLRRAEREKKEKAREERTAARFAEHVAEVAEREDIDVADALDAVGFDPGEWGYHDAADMEAMARDTLDFGEEFFDFNMVDLEADDDDKYRNR